MKYFISDLIVGINHFSEFADWIDSQHQPDFGIEFTAFTHDENYWERLSHKVPEMSCPMTFHGPYINIEATSPLDSKEHDWLMESYNRVFALAAPNGVRHVVFHYSQLQFNEEEIPSKQKNAYAVMRDLTKLAKRYGVNCVIENLCRQRHKTHLFTNEEYFDIFRNIPDAVALIDIGHANVNKLDIEKFLYEYGKRVKGFHVHNNDGITDQHKDYHKGTADTRQIMHWVGKYTDDADIVIEYEPHEKLTHAELIDEVKELKGWVEEGME